MTIQKTKKEAFIRATGKALACALGAAVLGFVGMKVYPIVHGPAIDLSTLSDGGTVTEPMVRISGIAKYTRDLVINGNALPLSPDGSFDEKLVLNPGYNLISVAARDQFGTATRRDYSIILKEAPAAAALTVRY